MGKMFLLGITPNDPDEPIILNAHELGGPGAWESGLLSYDEKTAGGHRTLALPEGDISNLDGKDAAKLDIRLESIFYSIASHWDFNGHIADESRRKSDNYIDDYEPAADGYIVRVLLLEWSGKVIELD